MTENTRINFQDLELDPIKLKKVKFHLKIIEFASKFLRFLAKWDICFAFTEYKGYTQQLSFIILSRKNKFKEMFKIDSLIKGNYSNSIQVIYDIETEVQTEKIINIHNREYNYEFITFSSDKKVIEIISKTSRNKLIIEKRPPQFQDSTMTSV